jgi:hypothetical protein
VLFIYKQLGITSPFIQLSHKTPIKKHKQTYTPKFKKGVGMLKTFRLSGHTSEKVFYNYIEACLIKHLEKISKQVLFN